MASALKVMFLKLKTVLQHAVVVIVSLLANSLLEGQVDELTSF